MRPDHEAGLIMQEVMPAFFRDELREDDRHLEISFLGFFLDDIDKFAERLDDASVWRVQGHELHIWLPGLPFLFKGLYILLLKCHIDGYQPIWGEGTGIF